MHIHVFSPIIHIKVIKVCESKKKFVNQMFMTSNYLYIHYLKLLVHTLSHLNLVRGCSY